MPTDSQALSNLMHEITSSAAPLLEGSQPTEAQRQALIVAAEKIAIAAREPEENVYYIATQIAHTAAIRSVIAMGVLDVMPTDGSSISAEDLASQIGVNDQLLIRMLRACASTHFFHETSASHYAHNALSLAYTKPKNRNVAALMYDSISKGVFALPEFCSEASWQTSGTYEDGPFQLGASTTLGFWGYIGERPERKQLFDFGVHCPATHGSGRRSGCFPFGEVLAKRPCTSKEIAIVDVGGGRGQFLEAIKHDYPDLRGRLVLQDLKDVIEDARHNGLPNYIEARVGSLVEPQNIRGARIYHFRRVFHDWDDPKSAFILENTRRAMTRISRIAIAGMVLPDVSAPRDMALQDLQMMSIGGMERSETQWKELIEAAGLVLRKIWKGEDGLKHAVIEAVLPEFEEL